VSYDRAALQAEPDVVIGEVIRHAIVRHNRAAKRDQLGSRVIQRVVAAIRSQEKSPRRFGIGGVAVEVRAKHVVVATSPSATQLRASTKPGEST
jgi:hypothetical protein